MAIFVASASMTSLRYYHDSKEQPLGFKLQCSAVGTTKLLRACNSSETVCSLCCWTGSQRSASFECLGINRGAYANAQHSPVLPVAGRSPYPIPLSTPKCTQSHCTLCLDPFLSPSTSLNVSLCPPFKPHTTFSLSLSECV
jgi:hypothetical protein